MLLYYTGASNIDDAQTEVSLSLGNYISSAATPNDQLGATFLDVTKLVLSANQKQVFMLALKNNTGGAVTDVQIYYDYPTDGKYTLELAFVSPTLDSDGNFIFEKITSPQSLPLTGTFAEYNGIANITNIGGMAEDEYIGIWFKTVLNAANNVPLTDAELYDDFENDVALDTQEETSFVISYT